MRDLLAAIGWYDRYRPMRVFARVLVGYVAVLACALLTLLMFARA